MTLDLTTISAAVQSHALASGWFDTVNGHEPKNAPGNGLSASVWVESCGPVARRSGLAASAARVELNIRVMTSMLAEPQDDIDPALLGAADALFAAYSGDFTLGGSVAEIDLLGQYGTPLSGRAGYLNQDGKLFRAFVITLPFVLNDLWTQSP